MNEKMKLKEWILIFKRRFWFMFLTSISLIGLIFLLSIYVVKPTYEYSTQVLVGFSGKDESEETINQVDENRQLAISMTDIIQSPQTMTDVIQQLDIKQTSYELLERTSVKNRDHSQVITITVKNSDPKLTKDIALTIATQSMVNFKEYANNQQILLMGSPDSKQEANLLFPKPTFVIIMSIVIGVLAGIGLTLLREYVDDKIYNAQKMEELGIPSLGKVVLKTNKRKKYKQVYKPLPTKKLGEAIESE